MTHLPQPNSSWPPAGHGRRYADMAVAAAWYAGEPAGIRNVSGGGGAGEGYGEHWHAPGTTINPQGGAAPRRGLKAAAHRFWGNSGPDDTRVRRHLPVAEEVARASARQLFSERVQAQVIDPQAKDGEPSEEAKAAQRRLDQLLDAMGWDSMLLAAAEVSSAFGSIGFRVAFDKEVLPDRPFIARMLPTSLVPVYRWGQLVGLLAWQVLDEDKAGNIWRHVESWGSDGRVQHGLYIGKADNIGSPVDLRQRPETERLQVDAEGYALIVRAMPLGGRLATTVPNMLPDPANVDNLVGRSDFTPGARDLFDAIDQAYSQMLESLDDAKSRIIISEDLLSRGKAGAGFGFDGDRRLFTPVKMPPAEKEGGSLPIEKVQFEMHLAEFFQGIDWLMTKAYEAAGLNLRSDAGAGGRDLTATEVRSDDSLTQGTRDAKIRYWQPRLAELLTALLAVDVEQFAPRDPESGQPIRTAYRVGVTFPDAVQPTMLDLAGIAEALKRAGAASTRELVRTVRPDWTDEDVDREVARIVNAAQVVDPISFQMAGDGTAEGDGA